LPIILGLIIVIAVMRLLKFSFGICEFPFHVDDMLAAVWARKKKKTQAKLVILQFSVSFG
jgi:hypothetical protein